MTSEVGRERVAALSAMGSADWETMQEFCRLFLTVDSLQKFRELVASNTREGSTFRAKFERLSGLAVFLERYCSDEERNKFFSSTLKFIASYASSLRERLPEMGIPCLRAQESACIGLGRHLLVSLLANAFLCASTEPHEDQQNGGERQKNDCPLSFASIYHQLQTKTEKSMSTAACLHCCLAYFSSLNQQGTSLEKKVTFQRQVIPLDEVPSLSTWKACQLPLCAVSTAEDSSEKCGDPGHLQVDISCSCLSMEGLYESGDKTHCCMYPELLVSSLILEPLQDNEALLIKGVERFVLSDSSEDSHEYVGQSGDLDLHGNFPTSLVAIDPAQFPSPDQQYTTGSLLRELNKAFAGFVCLHETGDKEGEQSASSRAREDSEQGVPTNSHSSNPPFLLSEASASSTVVPPATICPSNGIDKLPAAKPNTMETEGVVKPSIRIDSIVGSIIKSGVEKAAGDGGQVVSSDKRSSKMDNFSSDLSGSILSSVLSEKPGRKDSEAKGTASKPHSTDNTKEVTAPSLATRTADRLSQSIIADVLLQDRTVPSSHPPTSPQTVGQPTSPVVEWRVHSYADNMADNILSCVFCGPEASKAVVKKPGESGQNSQNLQSSSVTGQTITLHEFTDDFVEGAMWEGLLIARLQARATERDPDFVGCEGGGGVEREGGEVGGEGRGSGSYGRGASELAETLVSLSIQNVLEDARKSKREKRAGDGDKNGHPGVVGGASRRSESPMRSLESPMRSLLKPGLLRQTLEKPKTVPLNDVETYDFEQSTSSFLLHLAAPSSRMSYAWSVASTRDEGSRPVSPTDMDRMALSFVCNIEEYCSLFAELVIRGAIAQVIGNKKYICHVPVRSHYGSRESLSSTSAGELRVSVPMVLHHPPSLGEVVEGESDTLTPSRLDTFLSTLGEAEPVSGEEEEGEEGESRLISTAVDKALLRKVSTGNWGCGQWSGGDPQLKSMLQWAAVSASGHSEMIYFPDTDHRLEKLVKVVAHIRAQQWKVGQLVSSLVDYSRLSPEERRNKQLFSFLLDN